MKDIAFRDVLSERFAGYTSRMWLDHCDENSAFGSVADDYPTYLVNNFKWLVKKFNESNGNVDLNIK